MSAYDTTIIYLTKNGVEAKITGHEDATSVQHAITLALDHADAFVRRNYLVAEATQHDPRHH